MPMRPQFYRIPAICAFALASLGAQTLPLALAPVGRAQFLDGRGHPLSSGLVYFCTAGSTCGPLGSTFQTTYASIDSSGNPTSTNTNPIILDSAGQASIFLQNLPYKMVVTDAFGAIQWTQDNVRAGSGGGSSFNPLLPIFFKTQNNIRYSSQFPGSDCGAQVNNAYADLPATGGKIIIDTSCNFVTPIVFATNHKPATLEGFAGGAVNMTYTATSGTAITLNYGTDLTMGKGIRDVTLTGPGHTSSTIGILVGGSNGAQGTSIENFKVQSFGTNVTMGSNTWLVRFTQGMIRDGGSNFLYPAGLTNTGENVQFDHVAFADAPSPHTNSIWVQGQGNEVIFRDCSFDQAQLRIGDLGVTNAQVTIQGSHFENPNFLTGVDYNYIVIDSGPGNAVRMTDDYFLQDRTSGAAYPPFIFAQGGVLNIVGQAMFNPIASTSLVQVSGNVGVNIYGFNDLSNTITPSQIFSGSTAGCVVSIPGANALVAVQSMIMKCGSTSITSGAGLDINTGDIKTLGQLVSNIPTGTPPLNVSSTTPVANLIAQNHPLVYGNAGILMPNVKLYLVSMTLSGGTATYNFAGPAFTSTGTYGCALSDASGSTATPVAYSKVSGSQMTVSGNGSDPVQGLCAGN